MYMKQMGGGKDMDIASMFPVKQILIVNSDNPLLGKLTAMAEIEERQEKANKLALHIYDLARLGHGSLDAKGMAEFLSRSTELIAELA